MFETINIDNNPNLVEVSLDLVNEAYGLDFTSNNYQSIGYTPGTLEADTFVIDPSFQTNIFSGNGNVNYGLGYYDTLDLSNISVNEVVNVSLAEIEEGGVVFDTGNGAKVYDYLVLDDGTEILFEGIESLVFSDNSFDLTINPDDPGFVEQWNFHTIGLQTAWNFTTGEDNVLIGVQDSGLGVSADGFIHEDLRDTLFSGTGGVNENLADDFFFGEGEDAVLAEVSHGTAVQGIIAGKTNNGVGVAGVNWNSDVFNIDVLDGNVGDLNMAEATQEMINEAIANGQKLVINMSLGGGGIPAEFEALVANNQDDVLFIISAGNTGEGQLVNPASLAQEYGNVIAVGAAWGNFDENNVPVEVGTIANYSSYGEGITLVAPTDVITTGATYDLQFTEAVMDYNTDFNGTSAAAPHVAGIASLVWSANGELEATQIKEILSNTAYDLGVAGYDLVYGSGMVNADAAVRAANRFGT